LIKINSVLAFIKSVSKYIVVILSIMTGHHTFSAEKKPLYFQAEKNNLQVLPQKFEYLLIDSDKIKLGDILIDSSQMRFQIIFLKNTKDFFRIRFSWPAGLFPQGEVNLFNNYGKSIWSSPISTEKTKIIKGVNPEHKELRNDLAEFTSGNIEKSILEDMKFLPFMKYCVTHKDRNTRIDLCSKELFLVSKNDQLVIKTRETNKKQMVISINEKEVKGEEGVIFLNDPNENIVFRAGAENGSTLEVETRVKSVDFRDVTLLDGKKRFQLLATGARPIDMEDALSSEDAIWKKEIPVDNPVVYLRGEGNIPMRQEFYVRGDLPEEQFRPFIEGDAPDKTYQSTVQLSGIKAENTQISQLDKNSIVEPSAKGFRWTLSELQPGTMNKRYLAVDTNKNKYKATYQIFRGLNKSFGLSTNYLVPSQSASATIDFEWWFENFLFIRSSATNFHWGISASSTTPLSTKTGTLKNSSTDFELKYRISKGLHLIDPSFGISLGMTQLKTTPALDLGLETQSSTLINYGIYYLGINKLLMTSLFDWWQLTGKYSPGNSSETFKISSSLLAQAQLISIIKQKHELSFALTIRQTKFDADTEASKMQFGPDFKYQFRF